MKDYKAKRPLQRKLKGKTPHCTAVRDERVIRTQRVIRNVVEDLLSGLPAQDISAKFHQSVARLITLMATKIRDERKLNRVALSGGVFQNVLLLKATSELLNAAGLEVFTHTSVPANDRGISLGQAAVANAMISAHR